MKNILSILVVAGITFFYSSCKKSGNDSMQAPEEIPEPIKPDTLSTGWSKITIPGEAFNDIYFANPTTGYLAGKKLYRSDNGGLTWDSVYNFEFYNIGMTNSLSAFFPSPYYGKSLRTVDAGSTYILTDGLHKPTDIFFINDKEGFIASADGLYATTDTGKSWTKVITPNYNLAGAGTYSTLFALDGNTIWVGNHNGIYKTNGTILDWGKAIVTGGSGGEDFISIFASSPNIIYASRQGGEVYKSIDGGANFTLLKDFDAGFTDIHFQDDLTGYVSAGRNIYKTIDGGTTWDKVVAIGNSSIIEIHFTDANHGWACTNNGAVLIFKQ